MPQSIQKTQTKKRPGLWPSTETVSILGLSRKTVEAEIILVSISHQLLTSCNRETLLCSPVSSKSLKQVTILVLCTAIVCTIPTPKPLYISALFSPTGLARNKDPIPLKSTKDNQSNVSTRTSKELHIIQQEANFSTSFALSTEGDDNYMTHKIVLRRHTELPATVTINNTNFFNTIIVLINTTIRIHNSWFQQSALFINCDHQEDGDFHSVVSVKNSTFLDTKISGAPLLFGCLCCKNCEITIDQLSFFNNTKEETAHPGLITLQRSQVALTRSQFVANKGGVVHAENNIRMSVRFSTFTDNYAEGKGAVLSLMKGVYTTIENTVFNNNKACWGGAVFAEKNVSLFVTRCKFSKNIAKQEAVRVFSWRQFLLRSWLHGNYADAGITRQTKQELPFLFNRASAGGALWVANDILLTIKQSSFLGNRAQDGACLSAVKNVTLSIESSTFVKNLAVSGKGGVVHGSSDVSMTTHSCLFLYNTANWGGVVFAQNNFDLIVTSSNFTRNRAWTFGGIVFANKKASVLLDTSCFHGNRAGLFGGVVFAEKRVNVSLVSCVYVVNVATEKGGVAFLRQDVVLTVVSSIFRNNRAHSRSFAMQQGGGVVHAGKHVVVSIEASEFISNTAGFLGATVFATGHVVIEIVSSNFSNNSAGLYGGVVHAELHTLVEITASHFSRNKADLCGGVVNAKSDVTLRINSSSIVGNSAGTKGGVLSVWQNVDVSMCFSNLHENRAAWHGGVIHARRDITLDLMYSVLTGNHADDWGGVVVMREGVRLTVNNSNFTENYVGRQGIDWMDSEPVHRAGGVVAAVNNVILTVHTSRFVSNSANFGAIVHAQKISAAFSFSHFADNLALHGAVFHAESSFLKFASCYLWKNTAKMAGVLWLQKTKLNLTETYLEQNNGTAIILQKQESQSCGKQWSHLANCIFENNFNDRSKYGEDLFVSVPVILSNVSVVKHWSSNAFQSVIVTSESIVVSLLFNIKAGTMVNVAGFNQLHWRPSLGNMNKIHLRCPKFFKPQTDYMGLTNDGVSAVRLNCEPCVSGYWVGDRSKETMIIGDVYLEGILQQSKNHICQIQKHGKQTTMSHIGQVKTTEITFYFCLTKTQGKCNVCPHGANCSLGVTTFPNFWGHQSSSGHVSVEKCPQGFCCSKAPCLDLSSCAGNRQGTLCGTCSAGYSEALLSEECLPEDLCDHSWLFGLYSLFLFHFSVIVVFGSSIKELSKSLWQELSTGKWRNPRSVRLTLQSPSDKDLDFVPPKHKETKLKGIFQIGAASDSSVDNKSGMGIKYLQIVLFYMQDASLLQVELHKSESVTSDFTWSDYMFKAVHFTYEIVNFGKSVCVSKNTTSIHKIFWKSMSGPLILMLYLFSYVAFHLITKLLKFKNPCVKTFLYTNLSSATTFVLLIFFQKIATSSLSLLYCLQVGDDFVLFSDGTVKCYQIWQYGVFIFVVGWVVPFVIILAVGPALLAENKINVSEFFFSCFLPIPLLLFWIYKRSQNQWKTRWRKVDIWHTELVNSLQNTYKEISVAGLGSISWNGIIKFRRLVLAFVSVFVNNLVFRLATMVIFTALFLGLHLTVNPYQDKVANVLFVLSMYAVLFLGFIGVVKASFAEGLVQLENVDNILYVCKQATNIILLWIPVCVLVLFLLVSIVNRTLRKWLFKGETLETEHQPVSQRRSSI